jgi:Flp pilus assembly protein TadD
MPANSEIEKLERRWRENPKGTVFAPYAEVLRKNGDHALARDVLRQGLELHPDHIPGNIVLGRCCLDLGEDGPAEAAFAHVLDLDAENVIALKALGDITERQGRLAEAAAWFNRLISVDPSNDEARDQYARVASAQAAAAATLASGFTTREVAVPTPESSAITEVVAARRPPELAPTPEFYNRTESDAGEIATGDFPVVEAAVDQSLNEPAASPPVGHVPEPGLAKTRPVMPAFQLEPTPIPDLEPAELDLAAASRELVPERLADLDLDEPFMPPQPPPPGPAHPPLAPPDEFAVGLEEVASIELSAAAVSEFQAPDDSAALRATTGAKSEFQTPDASDDLRVSHGAMDFQTPSEPEPETAEPRAAWGAPTEPSDLAALAELPTAEMPTEPLSAPPASPPVPSWFFDTGERAAAAPVSEPTPEPEPVVAESAQPVEPAQPKPKEVEGAPRASGELKLIFPDEAEKPAPHTVRRITEAGIKVEVEPAIREPEPIMTETMAELYARQGHTSEALRVYRALAQRQPNDARLHARIRELETRPGGAPRRLAYVAVETGGESVESFFRSLAEARPGSGGAVGGFPSPAQADDSGGAPTRPARDPLSLSAIFGEEPAASAPAPTPEPPLPPKPAPGPDAFSFDQFFGGTGGPAPGPTSPSRPTGPSDEDLDQFQNWLKSLKR